MVKLKQLSTTQCFELETVEITDDPTLFERYFLSIPVVELDGQVVFQASDMQKPQDIELKLEKIVSQLQT